MEQGNVFYEFSVLLASAGLLGFVAHRLKQPLIVAFIAVGILVGPSGLKWVSIGSEIDLLAKTGIALLLFTVGLKLDLNIIRTMGAVSLVGLITITLSTYLIVYSYRLYERLAPLLSRFERRNPFREVQLETMTELSREFDAIVFGMGRFGNHLARELTQRGRRVLGVDFDPDVVKRLGDSGHSIVYGDAEDPELASMLPLAHVNWVFCSVPQPGVNLALLYALSRYGFAGQTATTAHSMHNAEELRKAGSDVVLLPFVDAAKEAVDQVCARVALAPPSCRRGPDVSVEEQSG